MAYSSDESGVDYDAARARHEVVKIEEREFNLAVKKGEYLPRVMVQQASATILAVLTQGVRAIPDTLERKLGLDPKVIEAISAELDGQLAAMAASLKAMHDG